MKASELSKSLNVQMGYNKTFTFSNKIGNFEKIQISEGWNGRTEITLIETVILPDNFKTTSYTNYNKLTASIKKQIVSDLLS